jgi:hypothetical protein
LVVVKRSFITLLFAALLCTTCIDGGNGGGGGYSYGPGYCRQFTSCGTCTPVLGCGWCQVGTKGACVDQPNACAGASNFYWTWELSGCPSPTPTAPGDDAGQSGGGGASALDASSAD